MINQIKYAGINAPKHSLALVLVFFVIATAGLYKLSFTTDYRYFFGEDNPERIAFGEFQDRFGKTDNIFIVIKPKDQTIFNVQTLSIIEEITEAGWLVPFANRVDSITNFNLVKSSNNEIESIRLSQFYDLSTDDGVFAAQQEIVRQEELKELLFTSDLKHAAVNINVFLPDISVEKAQIEAVNHIRESLSVWRQKYPDHQFYLSGQLIMAYGFFEAAFTDAMTLIPFMYLVMIIILWILLRSFYAMLITLMVVFCSAAAGIGLASWLGITISTMSASAPLIILTVAVADCVHIIVSTSQVQDQKNKHGAILGSLKLNFTPVLITTVTTIIGFLSLNFNEMPPARDLGNIVALGVACAFLFSLYLLPPLLQFLPIEIKPVNSKFNLNKILSLAGVKIVRYNIFLAVPILILTVILGSYISENKYNDLLFEFFGERMEIRQDLDYVVEHFNGVMTINYMIDTETPNGIKSPQYQATLDRFKEWSRNQPEITNVDTISDRVKRLNQVLHNDDVDYYRIPKSAPLLVDVFTFYEMTIPAGVDRNYQVDANYSSTRVTVYLNNITTDQVKAIHQKIDLWFSTHSAIALKVVPTGPDYMFSFITSRTVESMKLGTLIAFLMISFTIAVALKSVRFGIISLIPNIIPLVIVFGLWGIVVGEVGMAAASVSVIALGLIIDDTVHFLSKYQYYRSNNEGIDSALEKTFGTVGVALLTTTLIIGAGFAVLSLSNFKPNTQMGILTSLVVFLALLVTYVITPFVIKVTETKAKKDDQPKSRIDRAA